jgi:hypothetical protein
MLSIFEKKDFDFYGADNRVLIKTVVLKKKRRMVLKKKDYFPFIFDRGVRKNFQKPLGGTIIELPTDKKIDFFIKQTPTFFFFL